MINFYFKGFSFHLKGDTSNTNCCLGKEKGGQENKTTSIRMIQFFPLENPHFWDYIPFGKKTLGNIRIQLENRKYPLWHNLLKVLLLFFWRLFRIVLKWLIYWIFLLKMKRFYANFSFWTKFPEMIKAFSPS